MGNVVILDDPHFALIDNLGGGRVATFDAEPVQLRLMVQERSNAITS